MTKGCYDGTDKMKILSYFFCNRKPICRRERSNMIYISPSILAADFSNLSEDVERVEKAGANYLHLDVMDGMFVPNISFGPCVISSLRKKTDLFFDVHLMIKDPQRYIEDFVRAGADNITIHYESTQRPREVLRKIKDYDMRASIAISPATPYGVVLPLLDEVDMVLVMTVEPGFGGQSLILETLNKVHAIRQFINERGLDVDIEVDGGITSGNIGLATAAGANVIVAGSAIFKSKVPKKVIAQMRESASLHPFIN